MQPESLAAQVIACALLIAALWQVLRSQVFVPISDRAAGGMTTMPDDDEQMPETDRAPSAPSKWPSVAYAVAGTAALRIALLVALHR